MDSPQMEGGISVRQGVRRWKEALVKIYLVFDSHPNTGDLEESVVLKSDSGNNEERHLKLSAAENLDAKVYGKLSLSEKSRKSTNSCKNLTVAQLEQHFRVLSGLRHHCHTRKIRVEGLMQLSSDLDLKYKESNVRSRTMLYFRSEGWLAGVRVGMQRIVRLDSDGRAIQIESLQDLISNL
ncbi:hypothetical protein J6590_094869, partial [Homalodisca vitripennis]